MREIKKPWVRRQSNACVSRVIMRAGQLRCAVSLYLAEYLLQRFQCVRIIMIPYQLSVMPSLESLKGVY